MTPPSYQFGSSDKNLQCRFSHLRENAYLQSSTETDPGAFSSGPGAPDKCVYTDINITNQSNVWDTFTMREANQGDQDDRLYLHATRELIREGRFILDAWVPNQPPLDMTDAEWDEATAGRPIRSDTGDVLLPVSSRGRFFVEPWGLHEDFRTYCDIFGTCYYQDLAWVTPLSFGSRTALDIIMRHDPYFYNSPQIDYRDRRELPMSPLISESPPCMSSRGVAYPPDCNNQPFHYHISVTATVVRGEIIYFNANDPCSGVFNDTCAQEALANNYYSSNRSLVSMLDFSYSTSFNIAAAIFGDFNGDGLPDVFLVGPPDFPVEQSSDSDGNGIPGPCEYDPQADRDMDNNGENDVCFKESALLFGSIR